MEHKEHFNEEQRQERKKKIIKIASIALAVVVLAVGGGLVVAKIGESTNDAEANARTEKKVPEYTAEEYEAEEKIIANISEEVAISTDLQEHKAEPNVTAPSTNNSNKPQSTSTQKNENSASNQPSNNSQASPVSTLMGDVNLDGKIDQADVDMIRNYIVGGYYDDVHPQTVKNADVNNDGRVNSTDTIVLRQYIEGMLPEVTLPIATPYSTLKGDMNLDGKLDQYDVDIMRKYIAGGYYGEVHPQVAGNGDMNEDGRVNATDVILLRRIIGE